MWKSLSRLTCLSGKKTAAPFRMALTASLCRAFSTNVSPSGPPTTETQTWQILLLQRFSHIHRNRLWSAATVQGLSTEKVNHLTKFKHSTKSFRSAKLYESWQVLTLAEVSVEFPDSPNRVGQRLRIAGRGWTSCCCGFLLWPSALPLALGPQWVGQHGETVLHQLEQQNSALQHLLSLTKKKTHTPLQVCLYMSHLLTDEPDHAEW